jgi:hypothetical protein
MTEHPSSLDILAAIQVERNHAIGKYNIRNTKTWSEYVDEVIAKRVEEKSKKLIEDIAKYHKEYPDFA